MATTEQINIKVSMDTSGVERGASKVKQSLNGIEGAANGVSGATAEASASIEGLNTALTALTGLKVAELLGITKDSITDFTSSITNSFTKLQWAIKKAKIDLDGIKKPKVKEISYSFIDGELKEEIAIIDNNTRIRLEMLKRSFKYLKKDIKDIGIAAKESFGTLWKNTEKARKKIVAFGAALIPIAGIMGSFSQSQAAKEIYNTSQRVGMATSTYQEWAYVLEQTGADITDLIGAQQTLTEAQLDVAEGAEEIIYAFNRIGLSAEEVMEMDRQELFERTIAGLQNIESGAERAAVGYRLLSSDANTLASLLALSNQQTEEMRRSYSNLGAIMSEELIGKSLQFQMALSQLRAAISGVANTLAEIFLPILTTVAKVLTYIIGGINLLIRTIFGLELTTSASGAGAVAGGINGFGAMADSIDEATGSAKELRRTLMGFDELNVLDSGGSSSSSSSTGIDLGGMGFDGGGMTLGQTGQSLFDPSTIKLDGWTDFLNKWQGVISTVIPIAMKYIGIIGCVACLLSGNFVGALGFAAMAGIGMMAIDSSNAWGQLGNFFRDYNLGLIPIAMIGIGMVGAVMSATRGNWVGALAFASLAGIGFHSITRGDGFQLDDITSLGNSIAMECIPIIALCGALTAAMRGNIPIAIALLGVAAVSGIVGTLTRIGDGSAWDGMLIVFDDLKDDLIKYITPIVLALVGLGFLLTGNLVVGIPLLMAAGVSALTTHFTGKPVWGNLIEIVKEAGKTLIDWVKENILPYLKFEFWAEKFQEIVKAVKEKFGEAKDYLEDVWENIENYFNQNIKPKFTVSYWKKKFETIKDGAKAAFNGLIAIVEKAVNSIVSRMNKLSWSIPDWVPAFGGKKFGFNLPQIKIPRLASGGIATGSTIANIGEAGAEAILPLENNTGWMDALADRIASRNGTPTKIVLQVGEKELGWATINGINKITKQTGELQLVL